MKYIPIVFNMTEELNALKNQKFSSNIAPFIQLEKYICSKEDSTDILDEIEEIIKKKNNNTFFLTIPNIENQNNYTSKSLNRFSAYKNVIPVLEVNLDSYSYGDIKTLKNTLSYETFCFKVCAKTFSKISIEVATLINEDDYLLYDFTARDLFHKDIQSEITLINQIKRHKNFKTITLGNFIPNMNY
ncbi:hypothetical protein [Oceanirhabdus sp. W0125-5]|uniref:hypothetical protein n=1 Tax=Oceanirhabdus sp. W0125-5 TaxID=2999116 RepID=UPI0022F2C861|nr:hypothetical protein [Oceanirhabdus sp. W0125-5]WBW98342.1 hypothetical protein OW730_06125 [Oceanirhabdus sp. W0125-5]